MPRSLRPAFETAGRVPVVTPQSSACFKMIWLGLDVKVAAGAENGHRHFRPAERTGGNLHRLDWRGGGGRSIDWASAWPTPTSEPAPTTPSVFDKVPAGNMVVFHRIRFVWFRLWP